MQAHVLQAVKEHCLKAAPRCAPGHQLPNEPAGKVVPNALAQLEDGQFAGIVADFTSAIGTSTAIALGKSDSALTKKQLPQDLVGTAAVLGDDHVEPQVASWDNRTLAANEEPRVCLGRGKDDLLPGDILQIGSLQRLAHLLDCGPQAQRTGEVILRYSKGKT